MKNYQKVNVPAGEARVELHDSLNLTGAEVSISNLAGWCRSTFCAFAQAK